MAMVLGAAAVLSANGRFDGTVRVIFQPAEEPGRGAQAMLDDGLLDAFPIDALYGLHNLPGIPAGHLHTRPGAIMAGEDNFEIVVTGRGGHAARPHLVVDHLVVGAEIVLALQTIVARTVNPVQPAVLSCTEFDTDGARNVIPGQVRITGDTRSFDPTVRELLERRIRDTSYGIAAAHGATCTVAYTHEFAPTINDASRTRVAAAVAVQALSADHVDEGCDPIMPARTSASSPGTCPPASPSSATAPPKATAAQRCTAGPTTPTTTSSKPASPTTWRSSDPSCRPGEAASTAHPATPNDAEPNRAHGGLPEVGRRRRDAAELRCAEALTDGE